MIVDVIPVFVRFLISAGWGHVSEYVKNRIELYDSVKDNIKPMLYAGSIWVSWIIIFENIFELYTSKNVASRAPYTDRVGVNSIALVSENMIDSSFPQVRQAVEFLFFLALAICLQRMLLQAIGGSLSISPDILVNVHAQLSHSIE